jgi:hypothetical protein
MTDQTNLPPRFREKAFRRYETDLYLAVRNYPETGIIDPATKGLSPVTVAQRLRDAKTSYLQHDWKPTRIDRQRFLQVHEDLIVRETMDGMVKIGPCKEAEESSNTSPPSFDEPRERRIVDMTDCSIDEIRTMARLAHERALAVRIRVSIDNATVESLYDQWDIGLERLSDGLYILT